MSVKAKWLELATMIKKRQITDFSNRSLKTIAKKLEANETYRKKVLDTLIE